MMRFPEEYLLFKKEKNTRTHKKTRLTQPKETEEERRNVFVLHPRWTDDRGVANARRVSVSVR